MVSNPLSMSKPDNEPEHYQQAAQNVSAHKHRASAAGQVEINTPLRVAQFALLDPVRAHIW